MGSNNENELNGITVKNTSSGFIITLDGPLYKRVGENISKGVKTKAFYHQLKNFIASLKELDN